jgi:hypothetical protein
MVMNDALWQPGMSDRFHHGIERNDDTKIDGTTDDGRFMLEHSKDKEESTRAMANGCLFITFQFLLFCNTNSQSVV